VSRHSRRFGSRQPIERIRPTRADFKVALRQRATWIEIAILLIAGIIVGVVALLITGSAAGWVGMPILLTVPLGNAARRAAAERVEQSRSTTGPATAAAEGSG
jgi:hypothetical protein